MKIDPALKARLQDVANRQQRLQFWRKLATCWTACAFLGLVILLVEHRTGWVSSLALPAVGLAAILGAIVVIVRHRREEIPIRQLARQIEAHHPDLNGRLLTAVQQPVEAGGELGYLQERLLRETLHHSRSVDWVAVIPKSRLALAQSAHWLALTFLALVLLGLRTPGTHGLFTKVTDTMISVTPGDTNMESGNSLIVLARFSGPLPAKVDLVVDSSSGTERRIPLMKSLADPMFGGSVPEVSSNLTYHIEYAGTSTRDYKVTVFEYPRLERADAELTYPAYTGQPSKRIEDTRRLTAVEGSHLDLTLQLNKAVSSAKLITKDQKPIPLVVETNRAVVALKDFPLEASLSSELQLIDKEGRTNKVSSQFVFEVLKNRSPELRLTAPRGDLRPSALEEISFEGTVWDDFGVVAYGLGYTIAGQPTKFVELGRSVPQKEKRPLHHVLRLEELGAQPDQLIGWFIWADDTGPDGEVRRTASDLFFGEVRPFEEVFREAQGMEGQEGNQSGQPNEADKLAELQKQIINATWKLQREHGAPARGANPRQPAKSSSSVRPPDGQRLSAAVPIEDSRHQSESLSAGVVPVGLQNLRPGFFGRAAGNASDSAAAESRTTDGTVAKNQPSNVKKHPPIYREDAEVVRDSQAQALEKAQALSRSQQDPRASGLWADATKQMDKALGQLKNATTSPAALAEALIAEQEAYQALIRLQAHEYQVSRARNRSQSGSSRNQQMQRQLEEMDLTQAEDRYETQRQAQNPQSAERREDLQIMNRLQELARRQQDLNDRLKELQTALQEARNEQERQEIQRRLKRLQEEEQQMLADIDELRQRMDRPENQSRMSEERHQLEQTRNDVQRASQAAAQGEPSPALASGTRAQRQLQELRDQMRKENSNQFADDLRQMRAEARELERRQEEIQKQLSSDNGKNQKRLSESETQKEALEQLAQQKQRLTNVVEQATQMSQQAEDAEPLLSRQLYDTVRKFTQDSSKSVKELQDELVNQRVLTRNIYDRLRDPSQPDGPKLMDLTSDLLRQDSLPQAKATAEKAQTSISELKRGVEKAAESILGDDTEALRLAQRELNQLTDQLAREMAGADSEGQGTNQVASGKNSQTGQADQRPGASQSLAGQTSNPAEQSEPGGEAPGQDAKAATRGEGNQPGRQGQPRPDSQSQKTADNGQPQDQEQQRQQAQQGQQTAQATSPGGSGQQNGQATQPGQNGRDTRARNPGGTPNQRGELTSAARQAANPGGGSPIDWNRLLNDNSTQDSGPITGGEFGSWADRLRDVEEMIDLPELRNTVATARDRARGVRQEFRQEHKKPDWAVVRSQIMNPLVEVRDRIADELARRESNEALVPIDRDPVPTRYSDLVRKYYENLGKEK